MTKSVLSSVNIKDILKPKSVDEMLGIEKYFPSKIFLTKLRSLNPPEKVFNELLYNEHIRSINLDNIFRNKHFIGPIESYSDVQYILDLLSDSLNFLIFIIFYFFNYSIIIDVPILSTNGNNCST